LKDHILLHEQVEDVNGGLGLFVEHLIMLPCLHEHGSRHLCIFNSWVFSCVKEASNEEQLSMGYKEIFALIYSSITSY
jgi:hypothetical protein